MAARFSSRKARWRSSGFSIESMSRFSRPHRPSTRDVAASDARAGGGTVAKCEERGASECSEDRASALLDSEFAPALGSRRTPFERRRRQPGGCGFRICYAKPYEQTEDGDG